MHAHRTRTGCPDSPSRAGPCKPGRVFRPSGRPVSPVTDVHGVSLHVEASSLTQGTIESALARFVRDCLRSVRAAQICFRPCLAAALQSPAPAFQARYGHRCRGRRAKCCASGVVNSCRAASIYGRRRAQTCTKSSFCKTRFRRPLAGQQRQKAEAACRPQPSRGLGVHFRPGVKNAGI